ncbi:MAG: VIT family protein [Microgenomates bacterium OLB23]|nr:MAG: VIT family protein [Microgenomates bacterium OLB23]
MTTHDEFQAHLQKEHDISPFSVYLKEIVYGGIDGIVTTFAVVAGFSGAQMGAVDPGLPTLAVLLFGFANLFGDASSMGLGNFLSVRADQDVYKKELNKELHEIAHNTQFEVAETKYMLEKKGFTKAQANTLTGIYATNKNYWAEFMMKEELDMPNPLGENPTLTAITTTISFIFFGAIPLVPYVLLQGYHINQFAVSLSCALAALVTLGLLRWKVTGQTFMRSVGETVLIGSISAGVAYAVGTLFRA